MEIVPVLDLLNGQAVHAIGGDRANYQVVNSRLGRGSNPVALATEMLATGGSHSLYVADLGAITGRNRHDEFIDPLRNLLPHRPREVGKLYWDAGLIRRRDRDALPVEFGFIPVWGSETTDPDDLSRHPPAPYETAFSVDLAGSVILGDWRKWGVRDERDATGLAVNGARLTGAGTVFILDLHLVGTRQSPPPLEAIRAIRQRLPGHVRLGVGGGVRDDADLTRLDAIGVEVVLVATALHDGTLTHFRRDTTAG